MKKKYFWILLFLTLTLAVFISTCGTPRNHLLAAYQAFNRSPGPNSISMIEYDQVKDGFEISVRVFDLDVEYIYGAAFDIKYDANVIEFVRYEEGFFFEWKTGGRQVEYMVTEHLKYDDTPSGKLTVGVSLVGDYHGVKGYGDIIRIRFKILSTDTTTLIFRDNKLLTVDGSYVTGVSWYGGKAFGIEWQ